MPSERLRPLGALRVLGLLVALACGLSVSSPAAAGENDVCKPDPDCRPLCRAKARALLARCTEDGEARDACRRKARELRAACSIHECGGCEQVCAIVGQKLLQGCIEGGGELATCRAQADAASAACVQKRCGSCGCVLVYDPVCGVDGVTYGNACEAGCAGVEVAHPGACKPTCPPVLCDLFCEHGFRPGPGGCPTCSCNPPPGCDSDDDCADGQTCHQLCSLRPCLLGDPDCGPCTGVCLPRPEPCVCPEVYQPVCGADGKTYANACHAGCAGVDVAHEGACRRECGRNAECEAGEVCDPPTGTCRPQCAIQCFRYDPVCGTDGVTYGCGEADAHCHGVEVEHEGECRGACGPDQSCTQ